MGNTCVGPNTFSKNAFLQSVSAAIWRARSPQDDVLSPQDDGGRGEGAAERKTPPPPPNDQPLGVPRQQAPEPVKMVAESPKKSSSSSSSSSKRRKKKPQQFKRVSSAGLQIESVLQRKTGNFKELYSLGRKLGQGQFGTTYLCVEKETGNEFACKSILKRKLTTEEDVEDVRREIQIMHHLAGHPNVIWIKGAYEDAVAVYLVMELCAGGELFDRIIQKGHYTERKAA